MNINRHNYEEYFILYMDNELSSDDRRMVEAFVQQHPDLKEELDILLQYKLEPDTSVVFNGKEELMKLNGETPISLSNYEEWLVLYADNELTAAHRKSVEQFTAANPAVKEELNLMIRAKLQPEEIVFPYKKSLYRKEEKVRAVPFRWWRAAAAILIIALGISSLLVFNNKPGGIKKEEVANVTPGSEKKSNPAIKTQQTGTTNPAVTSKQPDALNETAVTNTVKQSFPAAVKQTDKNIAVKNSNPVVEKISPISKQAPLKKEEQVVVNTDNNKPSNNLPVPVNNPNINNNATNNSTANVNVAKEAIETQNPLTNPVVTNVVPVAYKTTEDADQLEEGSNNKKSRGLFRKIARTFEKRTNMPATDDNRLLVGGLSFKLK